MRTRRAETDLTWNGAAVTSKMVGYKATVTYTDAASGEADSLEISMNDPGTANGPRRGCRKPGTP